MKKFYSLTVVLLACTSVCRGQDYDEYRPEPRSLSGATRYQFAENVKTSTTPAPVAILKQINRHNEDGSYTYGYEGADGSFKIETKAANGDVKGKYGYFDGERIRVVEYGADRHGFQPSGEGITVPPPTLHDERAFGQQYEDEEQAPPQRQLHVAPRPKPQPRPQAYNFAPAPVPEKRKPVIVTQAPPQYYDYDEEVIAPTAKPVQQPPRPKFQQAPAPPRPQFANAVPVDVVYADARPTKQQFQYQQQQQQPQYETFESRQPQQFPSQDAPAPVAPSYVNHRPADFPLFSPAAANSRADVYKPKLSKPQSPPPPQPQQQQQPTYAAAPEPSYQFVPAQPAPAPRPVSFPHSKPAQTRNTSILDQLAKDYALPQSSSAALHDISFGYSL